MFDGIDTDVFSSFLLANEYYGVAFRGRIHQGLIFGIDALNEGLREGYAAALAVAQARPYWGIDISEMQGGVTVRGFAAGALGVACLLAGCSPSLESACGEPAEATRTRLRPHRLRRELRQRPRRSSARRQPAAHRRTVTRRADR